MSDFRRTSHGADAGDMSVDEMPLCALDKERRRDELRVERYPTFNQNITLLAVMDSSGSMQGMIALPSHALNETHEAYILGEVRKLRPETPGPDIRLVG